MMAPLVSSAAAAPNSRPATTSSSWSRTAAESFVGQYAKGLAQAFTERPLDAIAVFLSTMLTTFVVFFYVGLGSLFKVWTRPWFQVFWYGAAVVIIFFLLDCYARRRREEAVALEEIAVDLGAAATIVKPASPAPAPVTLSPLVVAPMFPSERIVPMGSSVPLLPPPPPNKETSSNSKYKVVA